MDNKDKALELKVGLFVFTGLCIVCYMVVKFGQVGLGFHAYYPLTVQFPNANGIIKKADVRLAGARIGYVTDTPQIGPTASNVKVGLNIIQGITIPRRMKFQVGSSGLMGDKFVEVVPESDFDPAKYDPNDPAQVLHEGDTISGIETEGLEALQKKGTEVLEQLKDEIAELKEVTTKVNQGVLSDANQKNLTETFANLKTTSVTFVDASKNINSVITDVKGAVETAKKTMTTADAAANDLRAGMADARKVLDAAKDVMRKASQGDGLLPTLLTDRQLADNVKALVANLRQRGVLFYKDTAVEPRPKPTPSPRPVRSR